MQCNEPVLSGLEHYEDRKHFEIHKAEIWGSDR